MGVAGGSLQADLQSPLPSKVSSERNSLAVIDNSFALPQSSVHICE